MVTFTVYKGSKNGDIIKGESTRKDPTRNEVLVEITHSGVCGTDEHYRHGDMVLGHEGTGKVVKVGPEVQEMKVGDRVGWGWTHGACGHCDQCSQGWSINCTNAETYGSANFDQGSFGSHAIWKENFLLKIPNGLKNDEAAPLMCGGTTVFDPLYLENVKATDCVGIVGIGGLGHLAIQFAKYWGCEVIVFSGTDSKKKEAMNLGAHHFIATKDAKELKVPRKIDHLLITTSQQPNWKLYLDVMAPRSQIYPLTIFEGNISVPHLTLLGKGINIVYSTGAPLWMHQKMLNFAALHGIKPIIQKFPFSVEGIKDALDKLDKGEVRYRGVLYKDDASNGNNGRDGHNGSA